MTQSEQLMSGVVFHKLRVDLTGFRVWRSEFEKDFQRAVGELKNLGLEKYNSPKESKAWLESLGLDCSRGAGKEVYENPANLSIRPKELGTFAEVRKLETLRRKINTFEKTLES